jgi:hypothetical protein
MEEVVDFAVAPSIPHHESSLPAKLTGVSALRLHAIRDGIRPLEDFQDPLDLSQLRGIPQRRWRIDTVE